MQFSPPADSFQRPHVEAKPASSEALGADPEPIGDRAADTELISKSTIEDWYRNARIDFALLRTALPLLNSNDKELEAEIRGSGNVQAKLEGLISLVEVCEEQLVCYNAGGEIINATIARAMIMLDRFLPEIDGKG